MLNYNLFPKPLIDPDKKVFNRGRYEYHTIEEVAEKDVEYLYWLVEQSSIDRSSRDLIEDFFDSHPEYLPDK